MSYQTPVSDCLAQIEIKKSIFKVFAYPVTCREQINQHVANLRVEFPDARHHCYGYIIGDPSNTTSAGFDDDGEPSSTAGKPILNVLQHKKIGNCVIVVVRYFGGIKLGAGGLTRAYSQSAQAVVEQMQLQEHVPMSEHTLLTSFAHEQQCRHLCSMVEASVVRVDYAEKVRMHIQIADHRLSELEAQLGMYAQLEKEN